MPADSSVDIRVNLSESTDQEEEAPKIVNCVSRCSFGDLKEAVQTKKKKKKNVYNLIFVLLIFSMIIINYYYYYYYY